MYSERMRRFTLFAVLAAAILIVFPRMAMSQATPHSARPQMVIIDTDIGDDIDDAFALALALKSPELWIRGITTAYGDTDMRVHLVDRFLSANCVEGIPVVAGIPTPHQNVFTQAAYARRTDRNGCAGSFNLDEFFGEKGKLLKREQSEHDAAGFILRHIRENPGQITLIAIGPLFNVQAAIEKDAATFRKLKRVVIMGGSIDRGYDTANDKHRPPDAEWNINRDPAGLRALLASGVPVFVMPLDSTQIHLEAAEREKIFAFGSPLTDQLTLLYHQWMAGSDGHWATPTLFDPVAVTYAIRPELCPAEPIHIDVDEKGFTRRGAGAPNAQVCLKSDEKGFLELLLKRLTETSK